jgi:hypothetical protein
MSSNNRVYTLVIIASGSVLVLDMSVPFGTSVSLVDHTKLTNIGTNTHAQIDTFVSSKGATSGLASLDGSGYVLPAQLGNVVMTTTKGSALFGSGTAPTALTVGTNNQALVADLTQLLGVKWAQVDHTTLANIGINTHVQIDTFISSKGVNLGLVTLDASRQVLVMQLGNVAKPTTKGQLLMGNGTVATTLDMGSDSQVLVVDSTQTNGVKWVPVLSPSAATAMMLGAVYGQTPDMSSNMTTYGYATSGQGWTGANQHSIALGTHVMENTPSMGTWCNTAIGATALINQTNSTKNTTMGNSTRSTLTTSNHCIFIGCNTNTTVASGVHRIAIGALASASNDYQFAIDPTIQEIKVPGLITAGDANGMLLVIDSLGLVHKVNGTNTTVNSIDGQINGLIEQAVAITLQSKGGLVTSDGSSAVKMSAGVDSQSLIADSTQANGIKWGTS